MSEGNIINFTFSHLIQDAAEVKKICDIYDWDGKGELDMYYFGDIMYAMGMNIMKSVCVKYGQTNDTGKKFVKFDDVVKLVGDAVKEPNHSGDFNDYVELMKLYDKNENGTMMLAERETFLSLMGKLRIIQFIHLEYECILNTDGKGHSVLLCNIIVI